MTKVCLLKNTVQFKEHTTIPKEQSENDLFDILTEEITDNISYCQALMDKVFSLP